MKSMNAIKMVVNGVERNFVPRKEYTKPLLKLHPKQVEKFDRLEMQKEMLLENISDLENEMRNLYVDKEEKHLISVELNKKIKTLNSLVKHVRDNKIEIYQKILKNA